MIDKQGGSIMLKTQFLPKVNLREYANYNNLSVQEVSNIYRLEKTNGRPLIVRGPVFKIEDFDVTSVIITKFAENYYVYNVSINATLTPLAKMLIDKYNVEYVILLKLHAKVIDLEIELLCEVKREYVFEAIIVDYLLRNVDLSMSVLRLVPINNYLDTFMVNRLSLSEMILKLRN